MEYKYKHHHDIKSLSLIIKDVNDQKRLLWEKIHLFNTLSYEKGSQKVDYLIRERIKGIQDDLSRFEGAIGLFEYGKNGDLKAYEDLLIFFVRNFIDKFELSDKLQSLKAAIAEIETKNEIYGLKYAGRDIIGKKNLLISELQKNLRNLETQLHHGIVPSLKKFLNDINHILFFEKATTCVNNIRLKGHFSRNAFNVEYLKNCITSFILFNHKINANDCSDISLKEFILNTLHDAKLEKMRTSNGANDKNVLDKIINKIFNEIDDQLQQMEETLCVEEVKEAAGFGEKDENSISLQRINLITRLKAILYDLNEMSTCESSEDHTGQVQEGTEIERYLFHIPGSFDLSLKTLANHMANILVFMYSWMLRELYHKNLPDDFIDNMNRGLAYSEEFIKFYCTAVNAAFRKSNQKKLLLRNEIQYYIPIDLAKKIVDAMEEIHSLLNDALIASCLKLPVAPFSRKNIVLLKKMEIVSGHLNSVWGMIRTGLGPFQNEI